MKKNTDEAQLLFFHNSTVKAMKYKYQQKY